MKIPQRTDTGIQEQQLQGGEWRVNPGDFGQAGIEQMNKATQGLIAEAENIALKAQKSADESVQLEAGSRLAQFEFMQNQRIRESRGEKAMILDSQYNNDYSKLKSDIGKLARNRNQTAMINRLMVSTDSQLRNNIAVHQSKENVEVYKNKSIAFIEDDRNTAIDSLDPLRIAESIGRQKAVVEQLSDFLGDPKEVKEMKMRDVEEKTNLDFISAMAVRDPEKAIEMLGAEDVQKMVGDQDKIRTLVNFAERQKAIVRREKKNSLIKNEMDTANDVATGKISSVSQVSKLAADGTISNARAQSYIKFLSDKDNLDFGDSDALAIHMDKLFELPDKTAINKLAEEIFSGSDKGRVSQEQLQTFLKVASIRSQGLSLDEYQEYSEARRKAESKRASKKDKLVFEKVKKPQTELDVLYKTISDWSKSYAQTPEEKEQVIKDFSGWADKIGKKLNNGESLTIDDAKDDIITKAQMRANPNRSKYKNGVTYDFPAGKAICVGYREDGTPLFKKAK